MTIIFLFVFFFHSHNLSTLGNDARHRWPSKLKHLFLCKDCFERVGFFGPKLFRSFLSKERIMAQKYFREMGAFWLTCPKASIWVISKYRDLGILRFWSLMGFDRLEPVASLDAYQITNYPLLSKTHHFLLLDFRRIREISF